MKRFILVAGILALVAGSASAVPGWSGGWIYWDVQPATDQTGGNFKLYKMYLNKDFSIGVAASNFDSVPSLAKYNYGAWPNYYNRDLEVLDPRSVGGTGSLVMADRYDDSLVSSNEAGNGNTPFDVIRINATTNAVTVLDGGQTGGTGDTKTLFAAVPAPRNWGGVTSNNVSLVLPKSGSLGGTGFAYVFDSSGNGVIDNNLTSEKKALVAVTNNPLDTAFGPDGALYTAALSGGTSSKKTTVQRQFWGAGGSAVSQTYLTLTGSSLINKDTEGPGIAVGGTQSSPIVYLTAMDCNSLSAIFACRDDHLAGGALGSDNVITWGVDTVVELWHSGQNLGGTTINLGFQGYMEDTEYSDNGTAKALLFNTYYAGLFALQLADNGMLATSIKQIVADTSVNNPAKAPGGSISGFALDMDPSSVPEPATLLLLGTGALGALGWLRRRKLR